MPKSTKSTKAKPELISLNEAASRCGVSWLTFRRWISAGRIQAVRIGPRLMFVDAADVAALIEPVN